MACNGTCWASCGASCSSGMVRTGGATSKRNNNQYNGTTRNSNGTGSYTGANGCWCGKDCAGCGGCTGGCSGCSGDCTGCSGACGGSCSGTCTSGCSNTCKGTCNTGCKGTCKGYCLGGCSTACTGGCGHLCNTGCKSNIAIEAYNFLSQYNTNETILDFLETEEMNHLLGMIQEEGRRRILKVTGTYTKSENPKENTIGEPLTIDEEKKIGIRDKEGNIIKISRGDIVDETKHIKFLNQLLKDNAGKSLSKSVEKSEMAEGSLVTDELAGKFIDTAISAYNQKIGINSTSEKAGKQEG